MYTLEIWNPSVSTLLTIWVAIALRKHAIRGTKSQRVCRFSFQPSWSRTWFNLFNQLVLVFRQLLGLSPVWLELNPEALMTLYGKDWSLLVYSVRIMNNSAQCVIWYRRCQCHLWFSQISFLWNASKHRFMSIWAQLQCMCVCVYCMLACHYQFHWAQMKFVRSLQTWFFVVSPSMLHFPFLSSWLYFISATSSNSFLLFLCPFLSLSVPLSCPLSLLSLCGVLCLSFLFVSSIPLSVIMVVLVV